MADYEKDLLRGLGETLAEETYLAWVDPDGTTPYAPTDVGLYVGPIPSEPRTAVAMNAYTVQMFPDTIIGVQFHVASFDHDEMTRAAQAVSDALEGRWGGTLGSVRLVSSAWQSGTILGQDANGREQRTDNYYLKIVRSTPHR